jgi:hypothetical protein
MRKKNGKKTFFHHCTHPSECQTSLIKIERTMDIDGTDSHRMLTQTEIDLEMWQAMSAARRSDDILLMLNRRYGRFYIAAENALLNFMITILYAVFEVNIKIVNFWRFKDTLSDIASPSQIFGLNDTYASIKQLWKKISVIRNEVVGHRHKNELHRNHTKKQV